MKHLLKAEEVAQLALAILAIYLQPVTIAWWLWPFLFLSPDIGMLGYLHNSRTGAWTYNLLHHKAIAAIAILLATCFMRRGCSLSGSCFMVTRPLTGWPDMA